MKNRDHFTHKLIHSLLLRHLPQNQQPNEVYPSGYFNFRPQLWHPYRIEKTNEERDDLWHKLQKTR